MFTRFHCIIVRNTDKGNNSVMDNENFTQKWWGHLHFRHNLWYKFNSESDGQENNTGLLNFHTHPTYQISRLFSNSTWPNASVTHRRKDGLTDGQAQSNMPPQLIRRWGHKIAVWSSSVHRQFYKSLMRIHCPKLLNMTKSLSFQWIHCFQGN